MFELPSRPDICQDSGFLWDGYQQTGFFGRFDPSTNDWANDQTQNVVLAIISDGDGNVYIDGELYIEGPVVLTTGCVTDTDSPLAGSTCATVIEYDIGNSSVCNDGPGATRTTRKVGRAEQKDLTWNGFSTLLEFSGTWDSGFRIEAKRVTVDEVFVNGRFYDGGTFEDQEFDEDTTGDGDYAIVELGYDGVCAYPGRAERAVGLDTKEISGETRAGTAPVGCGL